MIETIYCEVLERHSQAPMRVDFWFAEAKRVHWIEVYLGPERIYQSAGYADREEAHAHFLEQVEQLPQFMREFLEAEASNAGPYA